MKLVNSDNIFTIYNGNVTFCDKLPVGTYNLNFGKMTGFTLELTSNIKVTEKIYGPHLSKVEKVLKSFKKAERNLGVILSGDKGIGKSICAKLIAEKGIEEEYPVIIIKDYIPGISDYLSKIEQEVIVIFDEFDKTFKSNEDNDPQDEMLTLFDGLSSGKRLFVITCNELYRLNDYLVNRPGRFHYHFRFNYPTAEEITEYMQDKISKENYNEIKDILTFASKVNLNYDCLRAIATEINNGYTFRESLEDLNIVNTEEERYDVTIIFNDSSKEVLKGVGIDLFNSEEKNIWGYYNNEIYVGFCFDPTESLPENYNTAYIPGDKVELRWEDRDDEKKYGKTVKVSKIILKKKESRNIHYLV